MNSSSHHYLSCWPRNTTTAHLPATTLTYCTNGPLRRWSSVTMATQAPARIILVIPQDTLPTCIRVKKESITIEGCKSSIFVDDARNVCKETFSCSVLIWALDRFSRAPLGVPASHIKIGISLGDGPDIIPVRQTLRDRSSIFLDKLERFLTAFLLFF